MNLQSVALIRPVFGSTRRFLNAWVNSEGNGQRCLAKRMSGQGRPHLGFDELCNAPITIPSIAGQEEIFTKVKYTFSNIAQTESEINQSLFNGVSPNSHRVSFEKYLAKVHEGCSYFSQTAADRFRAELS